MSVKRDAIPAMIGKLVPRLASEHDGEVLSTVRAIQRALKSAGLDYHDLAEALRDLAQPAKADSGQTSWQELAIWCREHGRGRLRANEENFVCGMVDRLACGGTPSAAQAEWLRAIYTKLRRAG